MYVVVVADYNADLHAKSLNKASVLNLLDKIDGDEDTEFQQTLTGVFAGAKSATSKCNEKLLLSGLLRP
jgi:hypothetical protein